MYYVHVTYGVLSDKARLMGFIYLFIFATIQAKTGHHLHLNGHTWSRAYNCVCHFVLCMLTENYLNVGGKTSVPGL